MAKKTKSTFNESFKEGMGSEMGKKTGTIIVVVIAAIILTLWGLLGGDTSSSSSQDQPVPAKVPGRNGNVD